MYKIERMSGKSKFKINHEDTKALRFLSNIINTDIQYSKSEAERRAYAAIKRALTTPHKPHAPLKKKAAKKIRKTTKKSPP